MHSIISLKDKLTQYLNVSIDFLNVFVSSYTIHPFLSFSLFDLNKGTSIKNRISPYITGFVSDLYKSNSAKACDLMSIFIIYHMHNDYQKYI